MGGGCKRSRHWQVMGAGRGEGGGEGGKLLEGEDWWGMGWRKRTQERNSLRQFTFDS